MKATRSSLEMSLLFIGSQYPEGCLPTHSTGLYPFSEFTSSLCIQTTHHSSTRGGYEAEGGTLFIARGKIASDIMFPGKVQIGGNGELFGI